MKIAVKKLFIIFFLLSLVGVTYNLFPKVEAFNIDAPIKVTVKKISNNKLKISWNKVPGKTKYVVYKKKGHKYVKIAIVNKNKYIDKKVQKNRYYSYKIRSMKDYNGKKVYSNYSIYGSYFLESKKSHYTNVKRISIDKKKKIINVGSVTKLRARIKLENYNRKLKKKKIRWYSTNSKVAKVDKYGNIKALSNGNATIYAIAHNGKSASIKIKVITPYIKCFPILTFHRIVKDDVKNRLYKDNEWIAKVSDFEKQMKYLSDNHYNTLSLDEFNSWYSKKKEYPKKTTLITIDDGDYELYYLVYPILKKYNLKATSFIIGSKTDATTKPLQTSGKYFIGEDKINEIKSAYPKLEFESHSYDLHYFLNDLPVVKSMTYDDINNDFALNKKFNFRYIAYPYGSFNNNMISAAKNNNMKMGFRFGQTDCASRNDPRYAIPRLKINGKISYKDYVKKIKKYTE